MKKILTGLLSIALVLGLSLPLLAQGDVRSTHYDDLVFKERIAGKDGSSKARLFQVECEIWI